MIGTFGGMRSKMQSLSKMMKMGGGAQPAVLLSFFFAPSSCSLPRIKCATSLHSNL
jgi:hypothetical protein